MGKRGIITADSRHTVRNMRKAMQRNAIKALIELITNSDDSYIKLEEDRKEIETSKKIEIEYKKDGYCGYFTVRDFAQGMTHDEVKNNFESYGKATSGMQDGRKVRGYFGQGAKDALAVMKDGKISTFKNGIFTECKIFIENNEPMYDLEEENNATSVLRDLHKITENGTVAYFVADPKNDCKCPQFDTVREQLSNNYLLRKILTNNKRKIIIIDASTENTKSIRLNYTMPKGKEILNEKFIIKYKNIEFVNELSINLSETELTQVGDDRLGGILIIDDANVVLGDTLFRYDNEPLAAKIYGEVKIIGFRNLLKDEEPVLRDDRGGLELDHEFCKKFKEEIEVRIEKVVSLERERMRKEAQNKFSSEEIKRYKEAFNFMNEIAREETNDAINLGDDPSNEQEDPPNGLCIYPNSARITKGKFYNFVLRINTDIVKPGSTIVITSNNNNISINKSKVPIEQIPESKIIIRYIRVQAKEVGDTIMKAEVGKRTADSKISIIPEDEDLIFKEGMIFDPGSVTLRPNQPRKIRLRVYIKIIPSGSRILLRSDNPAVSLSDEVIIVNEMKSNRHIYQHELEIWSAGEGQNALITAECHEPCERLALLDVKTKLKEEKELPKGGMFNEPEYCYELEPRQRTQYSKETGRIIIYINFPSVKYYLGENQEFKDTLAAQVFLADIIAERCFYEIARKKVESSGALIRPETLHEKIQQETNGLSKKFGLRIHKILVNEKLFNESRK
jgi:hypothetical protein